MLVRAENKPKNEITNYSIILACGIHEILVDTEDYNGLSAFNWTVKKSFYRRYCGRWSKKNGKKIWVIMHRVITRCPHHMVIHHVNHNTFDNRKENLLMLTEYEHQKEHSWR